jgi:hypothetical protein
MEEVFTDGMPPAHMSPGIAKGVVLEEQVIFVIEVDQAVRIVGPVMFRGKMNLWPELFVPQRLLRFERHSENTEHQGKDPIKRLLPARTETR